MGDVLGDHARGGIIRKEIAVAMPKGTVRMRYYQMSDKTKARLIKLFETEKISNIDLASRFSVSYNTIVRMRREWLEERKREGNEMQ